MEKMERGGRGVGALSEGYVGTPLALRCIYSIQEELGFVKGIVEEMGKLRIREGGG